VSADLTAGSCAGVDSCDMAGAIGRLGEKLRAAFAAAGEALEWEHMQKSHPLGGGRIDNVIFCGMGGSAISGDLLAAALPEAPAPMIVHRGGPVPAWIGPHTLMVAISYSGGTEETLTSVEIATARGCAPVCVTSGGELAHIARERRWPLVPVEGGLQPRAALGHLLGSAAAVLAKAGLDRPAQGDREPGHAPVLAEQVEEAAAALTGMAGDIGAAAPEESNAAKRLARSVNGKLPFVYGAGVTVPAARRWKTQFNENAEVHAVVGELPEANHNEIVPWQGDKDMSAGAYVVALADPQGDPALQRRLHVTMEELRRSGVGVEVIDAAGDSPLARACSALYVGDWTSYYLAILRGVDPTPVEPIQSLKRRLAAPEAGE
jgi:glucose/mannose-6-phosphate isomerase